MTKNAEPLKILYRYDVDNIPLFYVAEANYYNQYVNGNFIAMDSGHLWALQCKTIPPEFILDHGSSIFRVDNECCELDSNQIVLKDIDQGCEGNTGTEVQIYLRGPSDDPEYVVLGFDENHELQKLMDLIGEVHQMKKIAPDRLLIQMKTRNQLAGTSFGYSSLIYNTITKTIYEVPDIFIESSFNYSVTCKQKVNIYFDARSALKEKQEAIIGVIHENISVQIVKYYISENRGYSVLVKGENIEGWVSGNDITMDKFTLSNAD